MIIINILQNANEQKRFLEITEAYETLKDPQKRHQYDLYGSQQSYTKKYDHHSQAEYNNLYYNGLYHDDPFVETLSGKSFCKYFLVVMYEYIYHITKFPLLFIWKIENCDETPLNMKIKNCPINIFVHYSLKKILAHTNNPYYQYNYA